MHAATPNGPLLHNERDTFDDRFPPALLCGPMDSQGSPTGRVGGCRPLHLIKKKTLHPTKTNKAGASRACWN